jgi:hypothetical protein
VNECKNQPAAMNGLYRFLGALLMKVKTGHSVIDEVGAKLDAQLLMKQEQSHNNS